METTPVFISYANEDYDFVKTLRETLEGLGIAVWEDTRDLRGGDSLVPEITEAIETARQVLVVLSPATINSSWVPQEIKIAQQVEEVRQADGYRVIPILLPGVSPVALRLFFGQEPLATPIELKEKSLHENLPSIFSAMGERLPTDPDTLLNTEEKPMAELILTFSKPQLNSSNGKKQAKANATLIYQPPDSKPKTEKSKQFSFNIPLDGLNTDDLQWYLTEFYRWPSDTFKKQAATIESNLSDWGKQLYQAITRVGSAKKVLKAWHTVKDNTNKRFSVWVDTESNPETNKQLPKATRQASSALLKLPWELLHDGEGYLFHSHQAISVQRGLPNKQPQSAKRATLPINILLVNPRPEDGRTSYTDHRHSALPLVNTIENLGELITLTVLNPPTLSALEQTLQNATEAGKTFDVLHFNGPSFYDDEYGLGGLSFEDPDDIGKAIKRKSQRLYAEQFGTLLHKYNIPLVFLEASPQESSEQDATPLIATQLLAQGISSVVSISHQVLVETLNLFITTFYQRLAEGDLVSQAMLTAQQALYNNRYRLKAIGPNDLHLQDWFVPVLYQHQQDPQLFPLLLPQTARQLKAKTHTLNQGALPSAPAHGFVGRSRALLALERILHNDSYAVIQGNTGIGKTTMAIELSRWLLKIKHFTRLVYVQLDSYSDTRSVLDSLGRQLLPVGTWSIAQYPHIQAATKPIERVLSEHPTLILLDNIESILPDEDGNPPLGTVAVKELLDLCEGLLTINPATRLLFTSQQKLPAPFNNKKQHVTIGGLNRLDAIKLLGQVIATEALPLTPNDAGKTKQELTALVDAVNRHTRALVLLAQETSKAGVQATTKTIEALMTTINEQYPDDKESSLYASVELALRTLSSSARQQIQALALFKGGFHVAVLAQILGVDAGTLGVVTTELTDAGLAQNISHGHLRLNPALPIYLANQLSTEDKTALQHRWAEGMQGLIAFMFQEQQRNPSLAHQLVLLELPNVLNTLTWVEGKLSNDAVLNLASMVEALLVRLGRPRALAQTVAIRNRAMDGTSKKKEIWTHARFETEANRIETLLNKAQWQDAYTNSQHLLQKATTAGEAAYPEAAYDLAVAHLLLGRVLRMTGNADPALQPLLEAEKRFGQLAAKANSMAEFMLLTTLLEKGGCLRYLGRFDEAVVAYEVAIERALKQKNNKDVAVAKGQLGMVRVAQKRYKEALTLYQAAKSIFEQLNQQNDVASIHYEIGHVHQEAKKLNQAKQAYNQALSIYKQSKNHLGEANVLLELGSIAQQQNNFEESGSFYEQALKLFVDGGDKFNQGRAASSLASVLIKLKRYNEAKPALHQAIECLKPFGHSPKIWLDWENLYNVELALENHTAAKEAWQQAKNSYMAYRDAGGESSTPTSDLCRQVYEDFETGAESKVAQSLGELAKLGDTVPWFKHFAVKLEAVLAGDRNPDLAEDTDLYYQDAAELALLLDVLKDASVQQN